MGATYHIVFKNRIIKQCTSSILKGSFSLFHSSFLSSSTSTTTTTTTRLKWFRNFLCEIHKKKSACSINIGISFQTKTKQATTKLRSVSSSRLIRHCRNHLGSQWHLISELVVRKYKFTWLNWNTYLYKLHHVFTSYAVYLVLQSFASVLCSRICGSLHPHMP